MGVLQVLSWKEHSTSTWVLKNPMFKNLTLIKFTWESKWKRRLKDEVLRKILKKQKTKTKQKTPQKPTNQPTKSKPNN